MNKCNNNKRNKQIYKFIKNKEKISKNQRKT